MFLYGPITQNIYQVPQLKIWSIGWKEVSSDGASTNVKGIVAALWTEVIY